MVETEPQDWPWVPAGLSAYARPEAGPRSGTGIYKTSHAAGLSGEILVWGWGEVEVVEVISAKGHVEPGTSGWSPTIRGTNNLRTSGITRKEEI